MRRLLFAALNCILAVTLVVAAAGSALAQDGGEDAFIADLFARMPSDMRVGQLFIVAFEGTDVSTASDIAPLILQEHVGGVFITPAHANIIDSGDRTPIAVALLTAQLQQLALSATRQNDPEALFIPLFIALEQEGGGPAHSAITSGLTPQPSTMAIGATWNPADAQAMGQIVGRELSALGINLLLGPSLDMLTQPDPDGGDSGVTSFGGDPYWVDVMAGAYVQGLRDGSGGRIAAVLKHFPGQGGLNPNSDTIDASSDQLRRFDLAPYFSLMQTTPGQARPLADAVLTTHARYRGFSQLRDTTRPISVDATAMGALLQLPEVTVWRDAGGLVVSESLGDPVLRAYYDSTGAKPPEQVALDAFLAGNDVLILSDLLPGAAPAVQTQAIRNTIDFFQEKYGEDLNFQARVDAAVKRILRLKYRLYPGYTAEDVVAIPDEVEVSVQQDTGVVDAIAQNALTRLVPDPASGAESLPVPGDGDRFLVFSDDRLHDDCRQCPRRTTLSTQAISQTLTRLFDVPPENVTGLGFGDLKAFASRAASAPDLSRAFAEADWIIFAQQNLDPDVQQSDAARLLLRNRPELLTGKPVTLFLFGPPYEVTNEDLSLITAGAYALYDNQRPFVDAAVRALFGDLQPVGDPPVSVEAVAYDLTTQTEPDPNQAITLAVGEAPGPETPTPELPPLQVDSNVLVRTGLILDRNGHPVPDGTQVQFTLTYHDADGVSETVETTTVGGAASIPVTIKFIGRLEISAVSEPALNSVGLILTIAVGGTPVLIETVAPRPSPTPTRLPTATPTPTLTPTATATPVPWFVGVLGAEPRQVNLIDFTLSMLGITAVAALGYWRESKRDEDGAVDRAVRLALFGALCGLIAYTIYGLGWLGADDLRRSLGGWGAPVVTLLSAAAPWLMDAVRRLRNGEGMGNRSA